MVAAKNSQAKNVSTPSVRATTVHAAACMRVQNLSNSNMSAGSKEKKIADNVAELSCVDLGRDQYGVSYLV